MGIPTFSLSKNELKHQFKYDDDEITLSDEELSTLSGTSDDNGRPLNAFQNLDLNRQRRQSSLLHAPFPKSLLAISKGNLMFAEGMGHEASILEEECDDADNNDGSTRTIRRSNLSLSPHRSIPNRNTSTSQRMSISQSMRKSLVAQQQRARNKSYSHLQYSPPKRLHRSKSDVDDVQACLWRAQNDFEFSLHRDFHRHASGQLRERRYKNESSGDDADGENDQFHRSSVVRYVSAPMTPNAETKKNLGKVHYQLAVLHGMDRFPEIVPPSSKKISSAGSSKSNENGSTDGSSDDNDESDEVPSHDAFSVLFHLSYAAAFKNAPACLAIARVQAGLSSSVSNLLHEASTGVTIDFEAAKTLLRRAVSLTNEPPHKPKVAAGCLLLQILQDELHVQENAHVNVNEGEEDDVDASKTSWEDDETHSKKNSSTTSEAELLQVLEDTLDLYEDLTEEQTLLQQHKSTMERHTLRDGSAGTSTIHVGDRVRANYCQEGTYYPGTVEAVDENDEKTKIIISVRYDDDDSSERLPFDKVRPLVPPTATQTSLGGPISDAETFGDGDADDGDDSFLLPVYEVQHELGRLKEKAGDTAAASALYEEASEGAMANHRMKVACEWSVKAAELQG
jgi:elongation factor 2 kinase